jgi:hypothetical protein
MISTMADFSCCHYTCGKCNTSHCLRSVVSVIRAITKNYEFSHHHQELEKAKIQPTVNNKYKWVLVQNRFLVVRVWSQRFWLPREQEHIETKKQKLESPTLAALSIKNWDSVSIYSLLKIFILPIYIYKKRKLNPFTTKKCFLSDSAEKLVENCGFVELF